MIPPNAGILSAFGTLVADVVKDYAQTVMLPSSAVSYEELEALFAPMVQRGVAEVEAEGVPAQEVMVSRLLDMRYVGQSYEVSVPPTPQFVASFHAAHRQLYGHSEKRAETEVVALRLRLVGPTEKPDLQASSLGQKDPREAEIGRREVVFPAGKAKVPLYLWERLKPGHKIKGPAIVVAEHSTALVGANDEGRIDGWGNLLIAVGA
jgi:N-methylhydantoinase A/oxoprolinase/acetone carboxylase beta subunit